MAFPERINGQTIKASWFNGLQDIIDKSILWNPTTVTATTYTLADVFNLIEADSSSNAVAITFPEIVSGVGGKTYAVKGVELSNGITIDGNGTDTIDGGTDPITIDNLNQVFVFTADEATSNWIIVGTAYDSTGGGGGTGGDVHQYGLINPTDFNLGTWDVTNLSNAVMSVITSGQLFSDSSYQIANAVGAAGEYAFGPAITVDFGRTGKSNGMTPTYTYNGVDGAARFHFWDNTNAKSLGHKDVLATSIPTPIPVNKYVNDTVLEVTIRVEIITGESANLIFDNITFSDDAFFEKDLISQSDAWAFDATTAGVLYEVDGSGFFVGGFSTNGDVSEFFTQTSVGNGYRFTANKKVSYSGGFAVLATGSVNAEWYVNGAIRTTQTSGTVSAGNWAWASGSGTLEQGEYIELRISNSNATASGIQFFLNCVSETSAVVHSDTGIENKATSVIQNNGTASVISQDVDFLDPSTPVNRPSIGRIDILWKPEYYTIAPAIDATVIASNSAASIVIVPGTLTTTGVSIQTTNSATLTDYDISINVSNQDIDYKNPSAYAVTSLTETCYLKEHLTAGADAGTFTSGSWVARKVNTLSGDLGWCTVANGTAGTDGTADQFILAAGKYRVDSTSPAYRVNNHRSKLVQDPDGTPIDIATSKTATVGSGIGVTTEAILSTVFEIATAQTFELQHRCQTTFASAGKGLGFDIDSEDEIYNQIKITKLLWR